MEEYYTFDDVLIKPQFSSINSRKNVDLSSSGVLGVTLDLPVISANMSSITGANMAAAMEKAGGLGILHRFMSIEDNVKEFKTAKLRAHKVGVSVGVTDGEKERALALVAAGADIICIDVAHGAQQSVIDQVLWIRKTFKERLPLIVGNFATKESIQEFTRIMNILSDTVWGPVYFKVGIGPGSVCTTRLKTGVGVPQLSAIADCAKASQWIIADGGMKTPGDIAKALAAGARAVMLGGMLAGTDETPGEVKGLKYFDTPSGLMKYKDKDTHKVYKGSAAEGYGNGWKTSEGVEIKVPCKGPVELILKDIEGGLRSAFTYVGASNLTEFQKKAEFIRVSSATKTENTAHGENNV